MMKADLPTPAFIPEIPEHEIRLHAASLHCDEKHLTVSTGAFERRWRWTARGLVTVGVTDGFHPEGWRMAAPEVAADWRLPGLNPETDQVSLARVSAEESTDDGFTSRHLLVSVDLEYASAGLAVSYRIRAYPEACGLSTQLWLKRLGEGTPDFDDDPAKRRTDHLPLDTGTFGLHAAGYFNDTQNRHTPDTRLLREEDVTPGTIDWANLFFVSDENGGLAMVKESHKCVNQSGVDTGAFVCGSRGLMNTGLRLSAEDLNADRYRWCWGSWLLAFVPDDRSRQLAVKAFDRLRFPVRLDRDCYIKANTWGSGSNGRESRDMAIEPEVLAEIDSVADLGIDGLQIDDGWQVSPEAPNWQPEEGNGWRPHPRVYPLGWSRVKEKSEAAGVHMALWAPAMSISLEEMQENYKQLPFWSWKLDFAGFHDSDTIDAVMEKVRRFIAWTGHRAQVCWDVTEIAPRFGYFWAREYGCVWLANRKPKNPTSTVCQPWLMLREAWELAHYLNLNKFQFPVQNFQMIDPAVSDAPLHSSAYAVALGLMGIPVFFQTTRRLSPEARGEIRELLALYRQQREKMFSGWVFPVGDEPSNSGWSGFQWRCPGEADEKDGGCLLVFRERLNGDRTRRLNLGLPPGKTMAITDLRRKQARRIGIDTRGSVKLDIASPADFLFASYTIET